MRGAGRSDQAECSDQEPDRDLVAVEEGTFHQADRVDHLSATALEEEYHRKDLQMVIAADQIPGDLGSQDRRLAVVPQRVALGS